MSSSNIRQAIIDKMKENSLSLGAIAKKSQVKKNTVYNIVAGLSKNPGIDAIEAIASALDCSIDELLGKTTTSHHLSNKKEKIYELSIDLFKNVLDFVVKQIEDKDIDISFNETMGIIKEAYIFSLQKNSGQISVSFIEWLIENKIKSFDEL